MGDKNCPSYLYLKGKTFYFNRHVPLDLKGHYKTRRIRLCLKTASPFEAAKAARSIAQRLDDYWMALRLSSMDIPALHLLRQKPLEVFSKITKIMVDLMISHTMMTEVT